MTTTNNALQDSSRSPSLLQFKRTTSRPRLHNYVVDGAESNVGNRPIAGQDRQYTCTIRPNGSGSIGIRRRKGELASERTPQCDRKVQIKAVQYLDYDAYEGEDNVTRVVRCDITRGRSLPLTLSEVMTGRTPKKRIAKNLTRHGKRVIESGAKLLEKRYGIKNLGFYTLTCPFNTPESVAEFNRAFPTIVKRFLEGLKRSYEKKNQKFSYVGVFEIQAKRYEKSGIAALHFHYIAPARQGRYFGFTHSADEIRDRFRRCIQNAIPGRECPSPRVGVELCRVSAASYIAKYYSKGISQEASQLDEPEGVGISSWYSVSRNLLLLTRITTIRCNDDFADDVIRYHLGQREDKRISFSRAVKRVVRGVEIAVGYVFTMNNDFMSAWLDHCKDAITEAI